MSPLAVLRPRTWLECAALLLMLALGAPVTATAAEPLGTLTGTVTGNGAPVASALVTLTPVDRLGSTVGRAQRTFTDDLGRYAFRDLATGWVTLHVRGPLSSGLVDTYWPQDHTAEDAGVIEIATGTATADVDLPSGGSASGQVVQARTGAPVVGARVTATIVGDRASGAVGAMGAVGGPGQFSLTGLPPVPVELTVTLPPGSPFLAAVPGRSGDDGPLRLDGGAITTDVTIGLLRSATISGTVLDDAGSPVVGADVRLTGCLPGCPRHATSDARGRYQLDAVAPGRGLAVVAQPARGLLGPWYPSREATARVEDLEVDEGDALESVDLTLTRPAFVSLDVLGATRVGPLPAIVRLTTAGRTFSQYFDSPPVVTADPLTPGRNGAVPLRLDVGPVPPGEYSVSISTGVADIGYLPTRWVSDSGTLTTPTIRLAPGEQNSSVIRLTTASGQPVVDGAAMGSSTPGDWPGLTRGFLDPPPWPSGSG